MGIIVVGLKVNILDWEVFESPFYECGYGVTHKARRSFWSTYHIIKFTTFCFESIQAHVADFVTFFIFDPKQDAQGICLYCLPPFLSTFESYFMIVTKPTFIFATPAGEQ